MQHDDLLRFDQTLLCRNEYNYSGICAPDTCPLSNSRYATIKEENGLCYLYLKTVERNHSPLKLWEKILLPKDYVESLKIIDKNLLYWPEFMIHKCKQRYTVIYQQKALRGAKIEKTVQKILLDKLKLGKYDEIYNFDKDLFEQISGQNEQEDVLYLVYYK
ncbi:hypothetical protein MXB_1080 [Myxobolus squamalis]|nr:hypothetical protein MXB_1080 [Myxobolus squamalis]